MKYLQQFVTTNLNVGGGIDASQTTGIVLQSLNNIDATKPSVACISWADPLNTSVAEWVTYTSINSTTNTLQGVTRGAEGYSAKTHSNGATVAFPLSKAHVNELNDAVLVEHTAAGVHNLPSTSPIYNSSLFRQAIINGNFDVWQRGTTVTPADTTTTFLADRWSDYIDKDGGTLPTLSRTRGTFTVGELANAYYYTRLTTNGTGTSLGNNSSGIYRQKIEHAVRYLCGDGKKVTISFWARSNIANKKLAITLLQTYGTGGSPSAVEYILSTPITLTSTLTKYTATFTTNTLSGKTFGTDNNDYIECRFLYQWGSTVGNTQVQASIAAETYVGSGTIDIAQVQLCAGSVALPFQPKSFEEELGACQRYYQKSYAYTTAPGSAFSAGSGCFLIQAAADTSRLRGTIPLFKRMRTTPTAVSFWDSAGTASKVTSISADTFTAGQAINSFAAGSDMNLIYTSTAGGFECAWDASAEL